MIGQTCRFRHDTHRITDAEFIRWLKRQVVSDVKFRDSLFLYYHNESGNYIIAHWVGAEFGRFAEIWNLERSKSCSKEVAQRIVQMIARPVSNKEMIDGIRQHERDGVSGKQNENDSQKSLDAWVQSTKLSVSMAC